MIEVTEDVLLDFIHIVKQKLWDEGAYLETLDNLDLAVGFAIPEFLEERGKPNDTRNCSNWRTNHS